MNSVTTLTIKPILQKLSGRFEDYVRGHDMGQVRLCSDNRIVMLFNMYCKDNPQSSTKIGDGWKQFCECNHFNQDDKLRFRYVYASRQAIFRVFKVRTNYKNANL